MNLLNYAVNRMVDDRYNKHNQTRRSAVVGLRLTNAEIDTIEKVQELGNFASKTEVVQIMLRPALAQFKTAIETKSVRKAAMVRIGEEVLMNKKLSECMKAAEVQTELFPDMEVSPA